MAYCIGNCVLPDNIINNSCFYGFKDYFCLMLKKNAI